MSCNLSLNGFYKGPNGDISWHRHGDEEGEYSAKALQADNVLLFGRVTYELMASYWPTPEAMKNDPIVADGMNRAEKIVFSRTLTKPVWNNTGVIKENMIQQVRKMKEISGKDMTILGSGSIVTQLAEHGLIDEYQIMVDPVALGGGEPIFKNIRHKLDLKLNSTKPFKSGVVLLCYHPIAT
jgi:dihydrofolate reductase